MKEEWGKIGTKWHRFKRDMTITWCSIALPLMSGKIKSVQVMDGVPFDACRACLYTPTRLNGMSQDGRH